jgi:hypothetical protein
MFGDCFDIVNIPACIYFLPIWRGENAPYPLFKNMTLLKHVLRMGGEFKSGEHRSPLPCILVFLSTF